MLNQISFEILSRFVKEEGILLKATHSRLCYPKICRIYKKMKMGIKFKGIKVADGVIIDGHHRYLASLLAGSQLEIIPSGKTSATKITEWHVVDFDVDDWDTEAKILMLNELDAIYNNVSIEDIIKLIE